MSIDLRSRKAGFHHGNTRITAPAQIERPQLRRPYSFLKSLWVNRKRDEEGHLVDPGPGKSPVTTPLALSVLQLDQIS